MPLHNQLIRWRGRGFRFIIFKTVHLSPGRSSDGNIDQQGHLRNYRSINTTAATLNLTKLPVVQCHPEGRSTAEADLPNEGRLVGRFAAELEHFRSVGGGIVGVFVHLHSNPNQFLGHGKAEGKGLPG